MPALLQTEEYLPENRTEYPAPTPLPEGMDICLSNTPRLQSLSTALTSVPLLPELLWLHEIFGPVLFDLSLTETELKYDRTNYGTVQSVVQGLVAGAGAETGLADMLGGQAGVQGLLELAQAGGLEAVVSAGLEGVAGWLVEVGNMVDQMVAQVDVEMWASDGLIWMEDLVKDQREFDKFMGVNLLDEEEWHEEGLLCLYTYFHSFYVLEWYYDYIGYDYYHEDFSFYYDEYDYDYYDYSGSGYDYYDSGSGSGAGSGYGDGFGVYDYDSYDDYYFYYEDHYADFHDVYEYFMKLTPSLRSIIVSDGSEEVALQVAKTLLEFLKAIPAKEVLDVLQQLVSSLQGGLEAGAMQQLERVAEQVLRLVQGVVTGEQEELVQGVVATLMDQQVWEMAQLVMHDLEQEFYHAIVDFGQQEGVIKTACMGDPGRGPIPIVCATSVVLWDGLKGLKEIELDHEVNLIAPLTVLLFLGGTLQDESTVRRCD